MSEVSPLITHSKVKSEWIDQNNHMNVAYYALAFDEAADNLFESMGISWDYFYDQNRSFFALGNNTDYFREVFAGNPLRIESRVIDSDNKRIHHFHSMYHADKNYLVATAEQLSMHIDMDLRRSCPFTPDIAQRVKETTTQHRQLSLPDNVGRKLGIRR